MYEGTLDLSIFNDSVFLAPDEAMRAPYVRACEKIVERSGNDWRSAGRGAARSAKQTRSDLRSRISGESLPALNGARSNGAGSLAPSGPRAKTRPCRRAVRTPQSEVKVEAL